MKPPLPRIQTALLSLLGLVMAGACIWLLASTLVFLTPPTSPSAQEHEAEATFTVAPDTSFSATAHALEERGFIRSADSFLLYGALIGAHTDVKAGEFRLRHGWSPMRILHQLTRGRAVLYRVSIREGLTWWQTADIVADAGLGTVESFADAATDPTLLARYNIPAETAEGYLFPETYLLPRAPRTPAGHADARPVVEAMLEQFFAQARTLWPDGLPEPEELHRLVILASVVEKETGAAHERERIAGVYANRLRIGMRLQADPTIIYGLGRAFDGNLTRKHLRDSNNPYNTYAHGGLPPGPICSPGLHALAAAKNPEQHKLLYFVSKKDGTHHFSPNLREHNAAVRKYQLGK